MKKVKLLNPMALVRSFFKEKEDQKTAAQYLFEPGVNREAVENCIEMYYDKEQIVLRRQSNLVTSFFPLTLVFMILYYFNVKGHNAELLVIQYCVYATLLIAGYIWYSAMNKRLNEFWEIKKSFINIINVVKE